MTSTSNSYSTAQEGISESQSYYVPHHWTVRPSRLKGLSRNFNNMGLLYLLSFCLLVAPVSALPDGETSGCCEPIVTSVMVIILAGHHLFAFSGMLISPCMGISSVLWLVMRKDAAIEPKWAWM